MKRVSRDASWRTHLLQPVCQARWICLLVRPESIEMTSAFVLRAKWIKSNSVCWRTKKVSLVFSLLSLLSALRPHKLPFLIIVMWNCKTNLSCDVCTRDVTALSARLTLCMLQCTRITPHRQYDRTWRRVNCRKRNGAYTRNAYQKGKCIFRVQVFCRYTMTITYSWHCLLPRATGKGAGPNGRRNLS